MNNATETQFHKFDTNAYDFHRIRAQQERQYAMREFFGYLFNNKNR